MMICAADFAELFPDQFENRTARPRPHLQASLAVSRREDRAAGPAPYLQHLSGTRAAGMTLALLPFMTPYDAALAIFSTYGEMVEGWHTVATAGERGQPASRFRASSDGGCGPQPRAIAEARQPEWGDIVRRTAA